MNVQEFCNRWGITRTELAILLDVAPNTVLHWSSAKSKKALTSTASRNLDRLDTLFTLWLALKREPARDREMFEVLFERGEGEAFK